MIKTRRRPPSRVEYLQAPGVLKSVSQGPLRKRHKNKTNFSKNIFNCLLDEDVEKNSAVDYVLPSTVADSLITDIQESIHKKQPKNQVNSSYNNLLATFLEQVVAAPPVELSSRTASGTQSSNSDSGLHNTNHSSSLQDSALESTSLSNDSTSNTSNSNLSNIKSNKMVAMVDIERDISQIGQDYVDSFGMEGASSKNSSKNGSSCRSSRSSSLKLRKNYHDIEAMKRGCPASRSGRFVLNTGVSSLVDELMCQFENLKTTHKV